MRTLTLGQNEQHAFDAGEYPQGNYPPARVDRIVANYKTRGHRAPLAPNHDTGSGKAKGYVEDLRAQWYDRPVLNADGTAKMDDKGNPVLEPRYALIAKLKPSPTYVQEVKNHEWPAYSIGLEYTGEDLNHLAPLGVKSPQVKGMMAPHFANQDGTFTVNFDEATWACLDPRPLAHGELVADPTFDVVPGEAPLDAASLENERTFYKAIRGFVSILLGTRSAPLTPELSQSPAKEEDVNFDEMKAAMDKEFEAKFEALGKQLGDKFQTALETARETFAAAADARVQQETQRTRVETAIDRLFFEGKKITAAQHDQLVAIFGQPAALATMVEFGADKTPLPLFDAMLKVFEAQAPTVPDAGQGAPGAQHAADPSLQQHGAQSDAKPSEFQGLTPEQAASVQLFEAEVEKETTANGGDYVAALRTCEAKFPDLMAAASA